MPDVIELRVHGVGGSPPDSLLGVAGPADCVREAGGADDGGGETAFIARREDRSVQGYVWGALTEKPLLQPFWLFLLPFTLVNVSGWMHPPAGELRTQNPAARRGWLRVFRLIVLFVAAVFTASYFVWLSNLVINRLYNGQVPLIRFAGEPRQRIVLGGIVMVLFLGVVYILAHARMLRFEGCRPPDTVVRESGAAGEEITLTDGRFWNRFGYAKGLLMVHVAVGVLAVAGVTAWSWVHSSSVDRIRQGRSAMRPLGIAGLATYTTEVALWAIVALALVQLAAWRRPSRGTRRFRWLGPATTATSGVAYGTMFLYALPLLFGANSRGRVAIMAISFGIGTLALLATGAGLVVWYLVRRSRELERARTGPPPFGVPAQKEGWDADELRGATDAMYARIASARAISQAGATGTVALAVSALAFLVSALVQFRFGQIHWLAWSVRVGEVVAALGTGGLLVFLVRNARKPNERRVVGIIWDVLTFWPRRFHPFGVRPYAERAVPEIEARLLRLVHGYGRRVVLSCHSQGTILGYAALVQMPDDVLSQISFLTYGTPLRQLYQMAFPAYFEERDFERLRGRLFDDHGSPPPTWRIFYRLTDYIGTTVFGDPTIEEPVPDPAEEPLLSDAPLGRPAGESFPDTPRTAWSDLYKHSYYNTEVALKRWLVDLKRRMADAS
jgi:hypothetical protein